MVQVLLENSNLLIKLYIIVDYDSIRFNILVQSESSNSYSKKVEVQSEGSVSYSEKVK